jgi:hypothetical protein
MTIEMNVDADRLALTQTLQAMIIDYWHDVDMNWGRNAADYFLPDGRWEGDDFCLGTNREEIRDFYRRRERQGGRVTFHAVENFRAFYDGAPDRARCEWVMVLWGGDGVPVLPTAPPNLIDFVTERWVLTDEGWRIAYRGSNPLLRGGQLLQLRPVDEDEDSQTAGDS